MFRGRKYSSPDAGELVTQSIGYVDGITIGCELEHVKDSEAGFRERPPMLD
jgi:hypothetical protein